MYPLFVVMQFIESEFERFDEFWKKMSKNQANTENIGENDWKKYFRINWCWKNSKID